MSAPQIPVYVINLDSRPDRWEIIRKTCLTAGIHPIRISAVKASPGWHGCALSHKKIAEIAKAAGHPWYLVLEDDATFSHNDWLRFMKIVPYLWTHQEIWNVFSGGNGWADYLNILEQNPILYHIKASCTHFLLVNKSAYDIIIKWTAADLHFDNYLPNSITLVGSYPFIARQTVSVSDISIGDPNHEINKGDAQIKAYLETNLNIKL